MLRDTSAVSLNYVPIGASYEIILCANTIVFINLGRFYVTTDKYMKARVFLFIFLYVEVIPTIAQFVSLFLW